MEWIVLLVLGIVIGAAGRFLHPGADPIGLPLTLALGVGSLGASGLIFDPMWLQITAGVFVATALIFAYSWYVRNQSAQA